jgi:phage gp29-like protein
MQRLRLTGKNNYMAKNDKKSSQKRGTVASEKSPQPIFGEVLSPSDIMVNALLGGYMGMGSMLGGGALAIPDNPTIVWPRLFWNMPFAMYVYEDMEEKDDMVSANLESRKDNVLSKPWHVEPAGEMLRDKKIAEFVEETLRDYMEFDEVLREMMDAIGDGVTIGEIEWANGRDRVYVKKIHFRQPQLFSFSEQPFGNFAAYGGPQTGQLRLRPGLEMLMGEMNLDPSKSLEEQLPYKWLVNSFRPKWGNRWGSPTKRRCFWWTWFKKGGLRAWLKMLEKGPGTVVAEYDQGEADAAKALGLAQAVMEESMVAKPKRVSLNVLEHVRGQMGSMHKDLVDDVCNNALTRIIKGQTLTSRGGEGGSGSRALGQVHERVDQKKTEVDAKCAMSALNARGGIVEAITVFHFGPQDSYPKVKIHYEPGADKKLTSDVIDRAHGWGLKIPTAHVYDELEIREPIDGEEVLPPPTKPPAAVDKLGESAAFAEFAEESRELIDLLKGVKKKSRDKSASTPPSKLNSKTERFKRLRPSMIEFSDD